jgi:hypothetical protein
LDFRGYKPLPQLPEHSAGNSPTNSDRPAPIIPHVHIDPAADLAQLVDELFLDMKFNSFSSQGHVWPIVYGPADPTDRPLDLVSSPKDRAAGENGHDSSALGDECCLNWGKINRVWFFHHCLLSSAHLLRLAA